MDLPAPQRLSNELIRLILDHIAPGPGQTVPVDARRFLSVESFGPNPEIAPSAVQDIGSFRLASKRFSEIGAPLLFTRVQARLSREGLQRLETLSSWPWVAQYVKKFSYMVPYFYCSGASTSNDTPSLLPELEAHFGLINTDKFQRKISEQRQIISDGYDADVLKKAVASFTTLQTSSFSAFTTTKTTFYSLTSGSTTQLERRRSSVLSGRKRALTGHVRSVLRCWLRTHPVRGFRPLS
jgi:hypothetical protein